MLPFGMRMCPISKLRPYPRSLLLIEMSIIIRDQVIDIGRVHESWMRLLKACNPHHLHRNVKFIAKDYRDHQFASSKYTGKMDHILSIKCSTPSGP